MASKMAVKDLHSSAPAQEEGLEELTESIKKGGIKMPLVVESTGLVIDGVRRLQVARNLGLANVPVMVSNNYNITMEAMRRNREHGECFLPKNHRRVNQTFQDVYRQMSSRVMESKQRLRDQQTSDLTSIPARHLLREALGAADSLIQAATQFHRYADDPTHPYHEVAIEMLARMDAGMSGSMATNTFLAWRRRADPSNILDVVEQRSIMENAVINLAAVCETLGRIQHLSPGLGLAELEKWRAAFTPIKGQVQQTMNRLRILIEEKHHAQGEARE